MGAKRPTKKKTSNKISEKTMPSKIPKKVLTLALPEVKIQLKENSPTCPQEAFKINKKN